MEKVSLWGEEFSIPSTEEAVKKITKKIKKPKTIETEVTKAIASKNLSIQEKIRLVVKEVYRILGGYKDNTLVIKSREELHNYIDKAIENGIISLDTETNRSLDPITCKLMGPCLYTPGLKQAYVPINHINYETGERLSWQVTEEECKEEFQRLLDNNVKIVYQNAEFDYRVIKCTCGISLTVFWDTLIATKVLDEDAKRNPANLKTQFIRHIDPSIEKYDIEHLFGGIPYEYFDPEVFALYAATDAYMTYMLYLWQLEQFNKPENYGLLDLLLNVEIPVIIPTAEMMLNGVYVDTDFAQRLSKKYHTQLDELLNEIDKEIHNHDDEIARWRLTPEANATEVKKNKDGNVVYDKYGKPQRTKSKSEQLPNELNLGSPDQMKILFYDVLGIEKIYKKDTKKGTESLSADEDALNTIYEKTGNKLCKLIIDYRHINKMLSTYVDKIPEIMNKETGRVYATFNQYGTETGRYSSKDPNMQNIPSRGPDKVIRCMFKASPGCIMLGSDFSAQEPRLLANYSQDKAMIDAYTQGKDLYAIIGTKVFHNDYWDNMESYEDGSPNVDGKKRRSVCKKLLLSIMYGEGAKSVCEDLAEQGIQMTEEEAQTLIDNLFKEFPSVYKWMQETEADAKVKGYVCDAWGRRRRLPDIKLPAYEAKFIGDKGNHTENPILFTKAVYKLKKDEKLINYENMALACKDYKEYNNLKSKAKADGIELRNNNQFIARATRQAVNSRIQGGAASMSKKAMTLIYHDEEMNRLGFKLLIMVHDELIGECPIENMEKAKERLAYLMGIAGKPICNIPMKCDAVEFSNWYIDEYCKDIKKKYNKLISENTIDNALQLLYNDYNELSIDELKQIVA